MAFEISVSSVKSELTGDYNMAVTRHNPVSEEETKFLREDTLEIIKSIVADYSDDSPVGVSVVGSVDNMHTNVVISINASHRNPAHLFKKKGESK